MRAALWLVLAGCQFSAALDGAPDAVGAAPPFCDPTDGALVACYALDGDARDGSANGLDAATSNVTFVPGRVGMAMQFDATSAADVPDDSKFDVAALSLEAWIRPSQLPGAGQRAGIVDMNGQYGFFLYEAGSLQCTAGGASSMRLDVGIRADAWTHVACTYDGATLRVYVDGAERFAGGAGGAISTGGTTGISLAADNPPGAGSRMIGLIDQVRLWSRARTAAEVCAAAECTF